MVEINHISASSVTKFLENYKEWYTNYVLGERTPETIYMYAGTVAHECFETFFNIAKEWETDISLKEFTETNLRLLKESVYNDTKLIDYCNETKIYSLDDVWGWVYNYIKKWYIKTKKMEGKIYKRFNRPYNLQEILRFNIPSANEYEILPDKNEYHIKGYIDALYYGDRWNYDLKCCHYNAIEDYKSSSLQINTIPFNYFIQLSVYGIMMKDIGKPVDMLCLEYLKYNERVFFALTPDVERGIRQLLKDVWKEIKYIEKEFNKGKDMSNYKHTINIKDYIFKDKQQEMKEDDLLTL